MENSPTGICFICNKNKKKLTNESIIDESLKEIFETKFPSPHEQDINICDDCINNLRIDYIKYILELNKDELSQSEEKIIESYKAKELVTKNTELDFITKQTFGDKAADMIAFFGGSWYFILFFLAVIIIWITINTIVLLQKPFDPYPFILLNLLLSCLSALQAPIILMSQNRQAIKDRIRAENDYMTNLKAEFEIQFIHAKLDQLIKNQWERLLKVQKIQIELLDKLNKQK